MRRPKYSVLIIDDEENVCQMMKTMLSGFELFDTIITCNSSRLAVQKLNNQEFDVIIIDNHMPNRLGIDLIKIILNFRTVKANKIIFMSGMMEDTDVVTAVRMGVKYFLIKPFTRKRVYTTLGKLLNQKKTGKKS